MSYKFKPQKSILVAGLMAAAYAQACYVQVSTNYICEASGSTVDSFTWADGNQANVIATSDFTINTYTTAGLGTGYNSLVANSQWCAGPAQLTDRSGHVNTINYWEAGSANFSPPAPPSGQFFGTVKTIQTCT